MKTKLKSQIWKELSYAYTKGVENWKKSGGSRKLSIRMHYEYWSWFWE